MSHQVLSKNFSLQGPLTILPGWFLVTHFILKELGLRSLMHPRPKMASSTFLMGVQFKHHSCLVQKKQYLSSYDNLKVLKLPYQQGADKRQFSMYILLPEAQDCIWSLAEKLSSEPEFLEKHIPTQKVVVEEFKLHKFKISLGFEAFDPHKGLGLQLPFSAEGDLSEMVDSPMEESLYVSSIFHKSFVEVNEEGTEAAAASALVISLRLLRIGPRDFVADHPFHFLIREDMTSVVLFIGHVLDPMLAP